MVMMAMQDPFDIQVKSEGILPSLRSTGKGKGMSARQLQRFGLELKQWRASMNLTVRVLERMTIEWVSAPPA
jgi:hypothetical protein